MFLSWCLVALAFAGEDAPATRSGPLQAAANALNPEISFIADVALAWFSDEPDQRGAHDPVANGFTLQQLELAVGASVDPYFRFDANIVFAQFGVEVEEVYGTTTGLPAGLQLRFGQFYTRLGRFNPTHPHTWDFADQPFAIGRIFGGEGNRGLGLEGSILLPLPWYVEIVASETMANGEATARSFYGAQNLGVKTPADFQTTLAVKQFFPFGPDWSLLWGLSWAGGPNPTGRRNRTEIYGTDLYLKWRPVTRQSAQQVALHTEWLHRRRQVPGDVVADWNGFTMLTWRLTRRWAVGARHEVGTAERGLDGSLTDEALDPQWTALRQRVAAAVTVWPTEFSRFRLQGHTDLKGWEDAPQWAVFATAELSVGAHGAHAF